MQVNLQEQIAQAMNRPMTEQDVRSIIEEMVHPSILGMGGGPEAGDTDFFNTPDAEVFLGYYQGVGVWKTQSKQDYGAAVPPVEWAQRVDAKNEAVIVNAAPVMHANHAIGSESEQSVSFASLSEDDQRWLFVEIDLAEDTATAKFSESADVPTDDPHTGKIRWRLSKWKRTATGVSLVRSAWPGGVINIPSVYGPQTW